jgi:hypothetical protein
VAEPLAVLRAVNQISKEALMIRPRCLELALGLVIMAVPFGAPGAALGQDTGINPASSRDTAVIKSQLRLAQQLAGEVVERLQASATDDEAPIDPILLRKAHDTYALIRSGRHGFELEKEWNDGKKGVLPDPLKDLAFKRVDIAWNLARTPLELSSSKGVSRQEYIQRSTDDLKRAIQLINQALAILP